MKVLCYGMALLSITACKEDEYLVDESSEKIISANIEAPLLFGEEEVVDKSRTYVYEDESLTSGMATMWRAKEVIGVYSTGILGQKNVKFTGTNKSDAATASFSGVTISSPKYAYYPFSDDNDGVSSSNVKMTLPVQQEYHSVFKDLPGDLRTGVLDDRDWFSSTFTFNRLVSIYRFKVDATGTPLYGSNIRSISLKINNKRKVSGNFTVNIASQEVNTGSFDEGNDCLNLVCSNEPSLMSGYYVGYMTALPAIQKGDEILITITTSTHKATYTRISGTTHKANTLYTFTMNLASVDGLIVEELPNDNSGSLLAVPVLTNMKFTAANNPGKILTRSISFNTSAFETTYSDNANAEAVCSIDEDNNKISLYLPYLNNRTLVPTFEIPEGCTLKTEAGDVITSGVTPVDFHACKQLTVVNGVGISQVYDVELTNTGLPVVVINQISGTTNSEENPDYTNASNAWYKATGTEWQPKDSDWAMAEEGSDNFMVYYADGSSALVNKGGSIVNEPVMASTRVRGNVTQQMPKKAFAVKCDGKTGVLGMPAHKRWVLLANWKDRTMMRNDVAFGIAKVFQNTFSDGLAWNPSGQFVELVYNGVYVGNYYLCEQVKIDGNRLDINDPYEEGDAFSKPEDYGYLLECDDAYDEGTKFMTKHYIPFLFKDDADANGTMLTYAQNMIRGVEENLYNGNYDTAYETLDKASMVDYWLIQELMMNSEMKHPKSVYMYINDGKVYAGPVWDFDWNTLPVDNNNFETEGYSYSSSMLEHAAKYTNILIAKLYYSYWKNSGYPEKPEGDDRNYMWYPMLVKDASFKAMAAQRWDAVKGALSAYAATLPAKATTLAKSDEENRKMWQMDTESQNKRQRLYGIGGDGYCGDEGMGFAEAVQKLSDKLIDRINGMSYVSEQKWPSVTFQKK